MSTIARPEGWQPIATAPKDGTPFVWLRYITVIHEDGRPVTYEPDVEIIRRCWGLSANAVRKGPGYWMGEYTSRSDLDLKLGWWMPLPPPRENE